MNAQRLPVATYSGAVNGLVAYYIEGKNIYFTSVRRKATSTINVAESVVTALSAIAGVPWDDLTFYDLQTHNGYATKKPGEFQLDQLLVFKGGGEPIVRDWKPVAASEGLAGRGGLPHDLAELPGVPQEVLDRFAYYINENIQG